MRITVIIILLSILTISNTSAGYDVDYYYNKIEALDFSSRVTFQAIDYQVDSLYMKYVNNSLYYPSTVKKVIWLGSLPLIIGELTKIEDIFAHRSLNGSLTVTINKLTAPSANVSVNAVSYYIGKTGSIIASTPLINVEVYEGDVIKGNFSKSIGYFADNHGNDTYLVSMSYLNLLEYEPDSVYTSVLAVSLTVPGNNSWAYEADISVTINTENNPTFDELMKERYHRIYGGDITSEITSDISEADLPISISNDLSYPFVLSQLALIPTLLINYRKFRTRQKPRFT